MAVSLTVYEIIIIIIITTTMFMVLSSWQSHCESSPGSFDERRTELVMGWVHPWVGLGGDLTA